MDASNSKKEEKKGFFSRLFEKLDKKLAEKSKKTGCCCQPQKDNEDSCCS